MLAIEEARPAYASEKELPEIISQLKGEMKEAAKELDFETAAEIRDRIKELSALMLEM